MSEPTTDPTSPDDPAAPLDGEQADAAGFGRHPVVIYTMQRFLLLAGVGAVLYLVGLRGVWLVLFAFLLSGVIAMVALKGSREGAAYGITHAVKKVNDRIDESSRAEDDDDLDDDLAEPGAAASEPTPDERA